MLKTPRLNFSARGRIENEYKRRLIGNTRFIVNPPKYKWGDLNDKLKEIREYKLNRQIKRIEGE